MREMVGGCHAHDSVPAATQAREPAALGIERLMRDTRRPLLCHFSAAVDRANARLMRSYLLALARIQAQYERERAALLNRQACKQ